MNLIELSRKPGNCTDKADQAHSFQGRTYLDVYAHYFEPIRQSAKRVLEIGVLYGHSLRLWRDFFPNATIYGADIDPSRAFKEERIVSMTADQSSDQSLSRLSELGPFDVVIDDGSHITEHIIKAFSVLGQKIAPGGFYCVEDTRCTYMGCDSGWPGMKFNAHIPPGGDRSKLDTVLLRLIQDLDYLKSPWRSIHFHAMQLLLEHL